MHYYKFNVADYRKDAGHLSLEESAIYRWLIDQYYLNEEPIPGDLRSLMRQIRLTEDQKIDLEQVLGEFFIFDDGTWTHPRIDAEIAEYKGKKKQQSEAGMASGKARRKKGTTVKRPLNERASNVEPTINHKPLTINHKKEKTSQPKKAARKVNFTEGDKRVAAAMFDMVKALNPNMKAPNIATWANSVRLIRVIDKKPLDEILGLFTWANRHDFWYANILSPDKLRHQWDTLELQKRSQGSGNPRSPAWSRLPADNNLLADHARRYAGDGLPQANAGESFDQYRRRLQSFITKKTDGSKW